METTTYTCWDDGGGPDVSIRAASPEAAARQFVDGCEWGDDHRTLWIRVYVAGGTDLDEAEPVIVERPAEVPECESGDDHDWQSPVEIVGGIESNPGVVGHGGGVIIREVCMRCGCLWETDTWAQVGGQQGYTTVRYEHGVYEAEVERYLDETCEVA